MQGRFRGIGSTKGLPLMARPREEQGSLPLRSLNEGSRQIEASCGGTSKWSIGSGTW